MKVQLQLHKDSWNTSSRGTLTISEYEAKVNLVITDHYGDEREIVVDSKELRRAIDALKEVHQ